MASDVKWIKIVTDIFDDEKILLIESMPEGDGIIVVWFKLLCLAGKQNNDGVFMLNDKVPYNEEMLAHIFRRPLNLVRMALGVFEKFGMVEIIENTITIPNWGKHQQLDKLMKRREYQKNLMAERRAEQKKKIAVSNDVSTDVSANVIDELAPQNKNKNKDIKKKDKDSKENTSYSCPDLPDRESEPPVYKILLNDKSYHNVTQLDMDRYHDLYPAVDISQEMRKMIGWCESNPTKRKTRRGVKAFITNWLSRAQDRSSREMHNNQPKSRFEDA